MKKSRVRPAFVPSPAGIIEAGAYNDRAKSADTPAARAALTTAICNETGLRYPVARAIVNAARQAPIFIGPFSAQAWADVATLIHTGRATTAAGAIRRALRFAALHVARKEGDAATPATPAGADMADMEADHD